MLAPHGTGSDCDSTLRTPLLIDDDHHDEVDFRDAYDDAYDDDDDGSPLHSKGGKTSYSFSNNSTESETESDEGECNALGGNTCRGSSRDYDDDDDDVCDVGDEGREFVYNRVGLAERDARVLLKKYGRNQLPENIVPRWRLFIDQFRAPMPIMIWIAIFIEATITNWIDMCILLVIQFANATIGFYELNKAGNAVAALRDSLKPTATCRRDGRWAVVDATLLVPGDLVLLASGSGELYENCREDGRGDLYPCRDSCLA
jgi:magnesium-transporting ATPase (P-type)